MNDSINFRNTVSVHTISRIQKGTVITYERNKTQLRRICQPDPLSVVRDHTGRSEYGSQPCSQKQFPASGQSCIVSGQCRMFPKFLSAGLL